MRIAEFDIAIAEAEAAKDMEIAACEDLLDLLEERQYRMSEAALGDEAVKELRARFKSMMKEKASKLLWFSKQKGNHPLTDSEAEGMVTGWTDSAIMKLNPKFSRTEQRAYLSKSLNGELLNYMRDEKPKGLIIGKGSKEDKESEEIRQGIEYDIYSSGDSRLDREDKYASIDKRTDAEDLEKEIDKLVKQVYREEFESECRTGYGPSMSVEDLKRYNYAKLFALILETFKTQHSFGLYWNYYAEQWYAWDRKHGRKSFGFETKTHKLIEINGKDIDKGKETGSPEQQLQKIFNSEGFKDYKDTIKNLLLKYKSLLESAKPDLLGLYVKESLKRH
jgi:hypothetical protein